MTNRDTNAEIYNPGIGPEGTGAFNQERIIPTPAPFFRMLLVSFLAAAIGLVAGVVAFALYKLIGLFTNLFFFHRWSADFSSAQHNHLGWIVIVTPVIGGLIVGVMAKYGSRRPYRSA